MCFFFFQAEDGIRDIGVTGVQTCALPILAQMVTKQGGIQWVIEKIQTMVVGRKSAKFGIGMLVGLTDIAVANNTVAIIINGEIVKQLSTKYEVDGRESAAFLDIFSCVAQGAIPHGAQMRSEEHTSE